MKAVIVRDEVGPLGAFGALTAEGGFQCYTLENSALLIPAGTYAAVWKCHPERGLCYELLSVKDRTGILIHSGNWFDDSKGCILLGRAIMDVKRKDGSMMRGVSSSRDACLGFAAHMERKPFELTIKWAPGAQPPAPGAAA